MNCQSDLFLPDAPRSPPSVAAMRPKDQMPLRVGVMREGYKSDRIATRPAGASDDAGQMIRRGGGKSVWLDRCRELFAVRPDWTAEEGIAYWAQSLKESELVVDKNLRPRFTDLTTMRPPFLVKTDKRRSAEKAKKIKSHIYERIDGR